MGVSPLLWCGRPRARVWPLAGRFGPDGSAVAGRLCVFLVADVLAPGGALALLAGFRQCQMREQPVGRGAVPMLRIGRDVDRVARMQHLRLLAVEADAADAAEAIKRLAHRV